MRFLLQNILLVALLLAPITSMANSSSGGGGTFPVKPKGSYINNPDVAAECLPDYVIPKYERAPCLSILGETVVDLGGSSSSGASSSSSSGGVDTSSSSSSSGNIILEYMNNTRALFENSNVVNPTNTVDTSSGGQTADASSGGGGTDASSGGSVSTAGDDCDAGDPNLGTTSDPQEAECSVYEQCTDSCSEQEVCKKYAKNDSGTCVCAHSVKIRSCTCVPKCTISDPVNYPACCSVEDKGDEYPCIKTCLLPNGDKVDIPENSPRCKNFKNCCYGQNNNGEKFRDPVETEPGDPKDQCRLKCNDICNDKLFVPRGKDISDVFPQCCTPPIPLKVACYCCRDNVTKMSPQCEYFRRMFKCSEAKLDCEREDASKAKICIDPQSVQVDPSAFDDNYDPYLEHDERFDYCSSPISNIACQYICRGRGVTTPAEAPTRGIWAPDPNNPNAEVYESNVVLRIHGNCAEGELPKDVVPWPPVVLQQQETCSGQ